MGWRPDAVYFTSDHFPTLHDLAIKLIRKDTRFQSLPVMIVSYKDRQEDRSRGLEAGADYYLTKASFHDETLLQVVTDLIGGSEL